MQLARVEELDSMDSEMQLIGEAMAKTHREGDELTVLEAGCGQRWTIDIPEIKLIGLDLDEDALHIRATVQGDLDQVIHGDIVSTSLPPTSFDVIYCAFVLEHVDRADLALKQFADWLRPGGLLVVRVPDRESVRGFVTRQTPHWVHVLYYRYVLGAKDAGRPGFAPYPTHYNAAMSRAGLRDFCSTYGFHLEAEYGDGGYQGYGRGLRAVASQRLTRVASILSMKKLTADHVNIAVLLRKTR